VWPGEGRKTLSKDGEKKKNSMSCGGDHYGKRRPAISVVIGPVRHGPKHGQTVRHKYGCGKLYSREKEGCQTSVFR